MRWKTIWRTLETRNLAFTHQVFPLASERYLRYVIFNLISMCAAVDIDLFHAGIGEELKSVLDQRSVGEGEQALAAYQ